MTGEQDVSCSIVSDSKRQLHIPSKQQGRIWTRQSMFLSIQLLCLYVHGKFLKEDTKAVDGGYFW